MKWIWFEADTVLLETSGFAPDFPRILRGDELERE